jgi:hypothetical protein
MLTRPRDCDFFQQFVTLYSIRRSETGLLSKGEFLKFE